MPAPSHWSQTKRFWDDQSEASDTTLWKCPGLKLSSRSEVVPYDTKMIIWEKTGLVHKFLFKKVYCLLWRTKRQKDKCLLTSENSNGNQFTLSSAVDFLKQSKFCCINTEGRCFCSHTWHVFDHKSSFTV